MRFIEEYRNDDLIGRLAGIIRKEARGSYNFMEVCGGHTAAIRRFGLPSLLPEGINLISGPGCVRHVGQPHGPAGALRSRRVSAWLDAIALKRGTR